MASSPELVAAPVLTGRSVSALLRSGVAFQLCSRGGSSQRRPIARVWELCLNTGSAHLASTAFRDLRVTAKCLALSWLLKYRDKKGAEKGQVPSLAPSPLSGPQFLTGFVSGNHVVMERDMRTPVHLLRVLVTRWGTTDWVLSSSWNN